MNDIVQAVAALDADPTNPDTLGQVLTQCRDAAQRGDGAVSAARKAMDDLIRRARDRGDPELAIQLIDMQLGAGLVHDKQEQADLLVEKGRICADDLLDDTAAEAAYRHAQQVLPDHEGAEEALSQIEMV